MQRNSWYKHFNQVDDSMNNASTKPTELMACEDGDACGSEITCGHGLVGCNKARDKYCSDDCLLHKVDTIDCCTIKHIIGGAFENNSGNVYFFQRKYHAKYQSYNTDTNTPLSGDPKIISESFKITSFTKEFAGVAYSGDNEIYVFQGNEYTKIDLLSGEYGRYSHTLTHDHKVDKIKICRKVTATYDIYNSTTACGSTLGICFDVLKRQREPQQHKKDKVTIERNTELPLLGIVCVFYCCQCVNVM